MLGKQPAPSGRFTTRVEPEYGYADQAFANGGMVAGGHPARIVHRKPSAHRRRLGRCELMSVAVIANTALMGGSAERWLGLGVDLRGWYAQGRTEIDGFPAPEARPTRR